MNSLLLDVFKIMPFIIIFFTIFMFVIPTTFFIIVAVAGKRKIGTKLEQIQSQRQKQNFEERKRNICDYCGSFVREGEVCSSCGAKKK